MHDFDSPSILVYLFIADLYSYSHRVFKNSLEISFFFAISILRSPITNL